MLVPRAPPRGVRRQLATRLLWSRKHRRRAALSATSRGCSRPSKMTPGSAAAAARRA